MTKQEVIGKMEKAIQEGIVYDYTYIPYMKTEPKTVRVNTRNSSPDDVCWEQVIPEIKNVNTVNSFGGEGQGDHIHIVLNVTLQDDSKFLVYFSGNYDSYNGSDWEYGEVYECEEYEKTVKDYRRIE